MNIILKKYVPGLSMAFSIIVLFGCSMKLERGESLNGFAIFVMQLAGYLVIAAVVDAFVAQINFKSYLANFICETTVLYPITLFVAWRGKWFGMRVGNMVLFSMVFVAVMVVIHIYFYYMTGQVANEINEYLRDRKDE